MKPITIQDSDQILNFLAEVALRGKGFTTDCLLDYVLDEGFTEPIYLNASGEDPAAFYKDQPQAWAIYQVREWKRVLTVSGALARNGACRSLKPPKPSVPGRRSLASIDSFSPRSDGICPGLMEGTALTHQPVY